ncbi:MAG: EscD/YscD/HrpQ family type III secretion system periplasmic domain-containing protein, partial [Gammaproteobacteria bacterium]
KGLYRDSELSLEQGTYTFGSSADNDINIEDPALRENEGRLVVSESGVTFQLETPAPTVYVGGHRQTEAEFDLNPYDAIYLGDFCFVVGREGEAWPEIDLSVRDESTETADEQASKSSDEGADEPGDNPGRTGPEASDASPSANAQTSDRHKHLDDPVDETVSNIKASASRASTLKEPMASDFDELLAGPAEEEKPKKSSNWRGKLAFVLLFFVVMSVGGFVGYNMWKANKEEEVQREQQRISNEEVIKDVIARSGLKIEIREPEVPGGKPRLVGYIASDKERAALITDLDKMNASYQSEVYVVEQMLQAGYSLLNAFAFDGVDLAAGRRYGTLVAKGYIENLDRWLKIKVVIERDIEGLLSLIDEVDTPGSRLQKLEKSITRAGLDREVK